MVSREQKSKNMMQRNLFTKAEMDLHTWKMNLWGKGEKDKLEVWNEQIYTTMYKIEKQGATVQP